MSLSFLDIEQMFCKFPSDYKWNMETTSMYRFDQSSSI